MSSTKTKTKKLGARDWLAKYYIPVTFKKSTAMSWAAALDHGIAKWSGLSESVLERYGLYIHSGSLIPVDGGFDDEVLTVDSTTCALCHKSSSGPKDSRHIYCRRCPLHASLGRPCDSAYTDDGYNLNGSNESEYSSFVLRNDAEPMLEALRAARKWLDTEEGRNWLEKEERASETLSACEDEQCA